ncbi:hypothetical protein NEAUS03_0821 [Nematocida ausubeli]|nr:hypothetical protein NEAUS03_0821 [Nematocida ausubeli]
MLYVIKEITGVGDTEELDEFRERLNYVEDDQKIRKVEFLHSQITNNVNSTKKDKEKMKRQIIDTINEKKLNRKRVLEEMLEFVCNEEADEIRSEINKLVKIMEERKSMDINALIQSYIAPSKMLEASIESDINGYLTEVIKKISLCQDISVRVACVCKNTLNQGNDLFGGLKLQYNRDNKGAKNAHLAHAYSYESDIFPWCCDKMEEVVQYRASFKMSMLDNASKKTELLKIRKKSSIMDILYSYMYRSTHLGALEEKPHTVCSKSSKRNIFSFFYGDEYTDVDTLLLQPAIDTPHYKKGNVWALLVQAVGGSLGSDHPFVYLADNLMGSVPFIDSDDELEMFMLLSHTLEDKYYPSVSIDKHAYKELSCFTITFEKVLTLASSKKCVSNIAYANIITNLIIKLQRSCLEGDCNQDCFTRKMDCIDQTKRSLFIRTLTLNGNTMEYITRIVISMMKEEKAHSLQDYTNHSNQFLRWIIQVASKHVCNDCSILVKNCCNLISTIRYNPK